VVANDEDLAPQALDRSHPAANPAGCARCRRSSESTEPVLLDWLVGLAFPVASGPFSHQNGVDEVPKWRILPDRFGAEANSPVMDKNGGGPLGVTELLVRPNTVSTYLKDDWSRDLGCAATTYRRTNPNGGGPPNSTWVRRPAADCGAQRRCGSNRQEPFRCGVSGHS